VVIGGGQERLAPYFDLRYEADRAVVGTTTIIARKDAQGTKKEAIPPREGDSVEEGKGNAIQGHT